MGVEPSLGDRRRDAQWAPPKGGSLGSGGSRSSSSAPEVMAANMKAALVNEGFQWGLYVTGEPAEAMLGLFVQTAEQVRADHS